MRPIAVIDAETDPFRKGRIPKPYLWEYYNGSERHLFERTEALAEFVAERDEVVYAHNGGKFDFHYLLSYLSAYDDITIINGRVARCNLGLAELRDSYCIVPQALATYNKTKIDYGIMEAGVRHKPVNWAKIVAYLHDDCRYLYELVTAYIARFGLELTVASSAMKQWRKMSNETVEGTNDEFYNAFSPYYYGGRVQCFRSGIINTDFSVYDINSAYPYAMLSKHPYSANYERSSRLLKNADFIRIRCKSGGSLPYRGGTENSVDTVGGLHFPDDDDIREFTVTKWEFNAALETDTIRDIKILESIRFMRHIDFADYVHAFWKEREAAKLAGDKLGQIFCKLMMNSLYGKFAANPDNYRSYMIVPDDAVEMLTAGISDADLEQLKDGRWSFGGELGPWLLAQRELAEYEKRYYNVATGASITGYVRAMLWRAIHSSKGVLYCDTDSIAVETAGASVMQTDTLGGWKHEGDFDKAGIAGKKLYVFRGAPGWFTLEDGKIVFCSAKPKGAKRLYKTASKGARLTKADLWKISAGGSVDYEPEAPSFSASRPIDWKNPAKSFINRTIVKTARI